MRELKLWEAINEAIDEEMARDESVFILGEGVEAATYLISTGLVEKYGRDRVMDTPLSETAIAGAAIGAAMAGYRPLADLMFSDFIHVAADEILGKAAYWRFIHGGKVNVPCVFYASMGGYGHAGPDHSKSPEAIVMNSPGLKLVLPSTPFDAKGLMKTAIRDDNPVIYWFHKQLMGATGEIPEEEYLIPFGKADVKKVGDDVTVVATSYMVKLALEVASELDGKISVEVIDPRTLEPLDIETILSSVDKTGRVVVVDEDTERCGVGAEIGMQIMEKGFDLLDAPVKRVCRANYPIAGGYMESHVLPQKEQIAEAIQSFHQ
jgi:pyruvate/2-oxoglutarate/acetoin dehydrogenase E1 component